MRPLVNDRLEVPTCCGGPMLREGLREAHGAGLTVQSQLYRCPLCGTEAAQPLRWWLIPGYCTAPCEPRLNCRKHPR